MQLFLYFIAIVMYVIGLTFIIPIFFGIIAPIPSMPRINRLLIRKIRELDSTDGDILDIGSGYGSTVFALAKAFPNRRIIACEISWIPLLFSKMTARLLRRRNIVFLHADGFAYAAGNPKVSSAFFYFPVTKKVHRSLQSMGQTYRGFLYANTYPHPDLRPVDVLPAHDLFKSRLFVYDLRPLNKTVA